MGGGVLVRGTVAGGGRCQVVGGGVRWRRVVCGEEVATLSSNTDCDCDDGGDGGGGGGGGGGGW